MAACAPSFSSCDVVPQQCYRRTAEESPAVSAPLSTFTTYWTSSPWNKKTDRKPAAIIEIEKGKTEKRAVTRVYSRRIEITLLGVAR